MLLTTGNKNLNLQLSMNYRDNIVQKETLFTQKIHKKNIRELEKASG